MFIFRYHGVGAKEKAAEARDRRRREVEEAATQQAGRYEGLPASELRGLLIGRTGSGDYQSLLILIHLLSHSLTPHHFGSGGSGSGGDCSDGNSGGSGGILDIVIFVSIVDSH